MTMGLDSISTPVTRVLSRRIEPNAWKTETELDHFGKAT